MKFNVIRGIAGETLYHFREIPVQTYFTVVTMANGDWFFVGDKLLKISKDCFKEPEISMEYQGSALYPQPFWEKRCVIVSNDFEAVSLNPFLKESFDCDFVEDDFPLWTW